MDRLPERQVGSSLGAGADPSASTSSAFASYSPSDAKTIPIIDPSTSPQNSRMAAIAKLKRAASTRESPGSDRSPATDERNDASTSVSRSNTPSPTIHRHTASEDTPLFQNASLERTASLLARSMAMAKLTGTAPPALPSFYSAAPLSNFPHAPLPSLDALRERAQARMTNGETEGNDSSSTNPLLQQSSHPALRRNHTVTGVGGAAQSFNVGLGVSVGSSSLNSTRGSPLLGQASEAQSTTTPIAANLEPVAASPSLAYDEDQPLEPDRAAARVNLMRKLSSRRLVTATSPTLERSGSTSPAAVRSRSPNLAGSAHRSGSEVDDADVEAFARNLPAAAIAGLRSRSTSSASTHAGHTAAGLGISTATMSGVRERPNRSPMLVQIPPLSSMSRDLPIIDSSEAPNITQSDQIEERPNNASPRTTRLEATPRVDDWSETPTPRPPYAPQSNPSQSSALDYSNLTPNPSRIIPRPPPSPAFSTTARKGSDPRKFSEDSSASSNVSYDDEPSTSRSLSGLPSKDQGSFAHAQPTSPSRVPRDMTRGSIPQYLTAQGSNSLRPAVMSNSSNGAKSGSSSIMSPSSPNGLSVNFADNSDIDSEDDIRRRGSSASSSVAFLTRGGRASSDRGSVAGLLSSRNDSFALSSADAPARLGDHHPPLSPLGLVNSLPMSGANQGVRFPQSASGSTAAKSANPIVDDDDSQEWILQEKRLSARVESKRQAALMRSKAGAFPPPEENYQFPSPTAASPQDQESRSQQPWARDQREDSGESIDSPKALFEKLAGSPRERSRPSPFPTAYSPRPLPPGSPMLNSDQDAVSPTGTNFAPRSMILPQSTSATPTIAPPMERAESSDSTRMRWLQNTKSRGPGSPVGGHVGGSHLMQRQLSGTATSVQDGPESQAVIFSEDVTSTCRPGSRDSVKSDYSSDIEKRRDGSGSSSLDEMSIYPLEARHAPVHEEDLPSNRIIAKLDALLETQHLPIDRPASLDTPPRKLLLHTPILQVVNAHTVKDRHLFLFTDLLLITKPLIEDDPTTGLPRPSTLTSSHIVKSVVELKQLKLQASDDPTEEISSTAQKKRHPFLVQFVDRFANDPKKAIAALIQKGGLSGDAATIANLIFRNPDLNRNQVGAYFAQPENRHILRAYIERYRFSGVRVDDALRMFLMAVRLPHDLKATQYVLGVVAMTWTETNGASGFDPSLTYNLVIAIMRLNDALHNETSPEGYLFSPPNPSLSVDDFIAGFRDFDPRLLVPEELLNRIYASVRRERIEHASDNAIFSMTPDIEATLTPARLPLSLTYRAQSDPITITIPEPDPKFAIKLHGTDLKFDPPHLSFAKTRTQTFRVTGTALGVRAMVLIKTGANAPRYQGLPLTKAFSIERAFMQHKFQVSFTNHLDVKRKYMFSTLDAGLRATWLRTLRERVSIALSTPSTSNPALQAAESVAVQVLRDVLIAQEEAVPVLSSAAPSPRPNAATRASRAGLMPRSRGGTPTTRAGALLGAGGLARSNSVSRIYAAHYKVEADLHPDSSTTKNSVSNPSGMTLASSGETKASREEAALEQLRHSPFTKTGNELVTITEQNSLLPVVLSFLGGGIPAAPLPMSANGSAFQLPPLPSLNGQTYPQASFISPSSTSNGSIIS